jgi:hypothetical protein
MALAAYIFIRNVDITNDNIKALVVAANLLCLLGQQPQNTTLIAEAKAVALSYAANANAANAAYNAANAAYNAANAANAAADNDQPHTNAVEAVFNDDPAVAGEGGDADNPAYYAANYAGSAAANAAASAAASAAAAANAVSAAYTGGLNNLSRALTCAAGLIYLNIYTLLTQTQ